jgi:hypothetical protein
MNFENKANENKTRNWNREHDRSRAGMRNIATEVIKLDKRELG